MLGQSVCWAPPPPGLPACFGGALSLWRIIHPVWLTVFLFLGMRAGASCLPSYLGSLWINLDCPVLILRASVPVLGVVVWKVPRPLQQVLQIVLGVGEVARVTVWCCVCSLPPSPEATQFCYMLALLLSTEIRLPIPNNSALCSSPLCRPLAWKLLLWVRT